MKLNRNSHSLFYWQVGVDNMCILVNALKRQDLSLQLESRVGLALAEVGPSITLASLAEVLAFAVGSFTPMPACRVFSLFAGIQSVSNYQIKISGHCIFSKFSILRAFCCLMQ